MIIEQDVLVRAAIGESLRDCGYHVIEGVTADDVRAVLESGKDLSILMVDARLQGSTNGFELARWLRQTRPGIDVILTSGVADAAQKSMQLCEQGPSKKPHRSRDLIRRIHLLFERRRSNALDD